MHIYYIINIKISSRYSHLKKFSTRLFFKSTNISFPLLKITERMPTWYLMHYMTSLDDDLFAEKFINTSLPHLYL